MNSYKFIKSTFLRLTSKTYPYGHEDEVYKDIFIAGLVPKLLKDNWDNYFYQIGDGKTIFTAHLDTACNKQTPVKHVIDKNQFVRTDNTTILGADDKAGVSILLWMIKNNIPGLYYFFIGEEVGCIGSSAAALSGSFANKYDRMISFDRRGTDSVITHQSSFRTCSDDFATKLSSELNKTTNLFYKPDSGGIYTDSAEFTDFIPECTNISVGYYNEHSVNEYQDLYHLNKLALAVLDVDWDSLPTKRDITIKESKWTSRYSELDGEYSHYYSTEADGIYNNDLIYTKYNKRKRRKNKKVESKWNDDLDKWNNGYGTAICMAGEDFEDTLPFDYKDSSKYMDTSEGLKPLDSIATKIVNENRVKPSPIVRNGMFDALRDKFLTSDLTRKELEIVKEQYLNMSDPNDQKTYDYLSRIL